VLGCEACDLSAHVENLPFARVRIASIAVAALLIAPAAAAASTETVGRSAQGRAINAERVGAAAAKRVILVVAVIHGNERAGLAVTRRLRRARPPRGTALLLVDDLNPDGSRAGTRQNARGVDLNRNFPFAWRAMGRPFDTHYAGPGPLSEPESRAAADLVRRVRPRVTLYYHQMLRLVDRGGGDRFLERLYARRSGLPYRAHPAQPGSAPRWQNHAFPRDTATVVELPGGSLSRRAAARHAAAVLALARAIAPPREVSRPIPFGGERRSQMRDYARRHYGIDDSRLRPRVIVQHFTASNSFASAFNTFASNAPDVEFGERPGVCAHYLIDRDGTTARLVPPSTMCRHTVGLNHVAIGIEHVGTSDGQVLGNRRQLAASLRLTRALQGRYRIATRDVIGHNENRSHRLHRERVARFRNQTHGDFTRRSMKRYRRALKRLAAPDSLR
jgi:hypothetical protein